MTTPLLRTALEPIVARHRRLRFLGWAAIAFTLCAVAGWLLLQSKLLLFTSVIAATWFAWRYATAWQPDYGALAREIEQKHPKLQHLAANRPKRLQRIRWPRQRMRPPSR